MSEGSGPTPPSPFQLRSRNTSRIARRPALIAAAIVRYKVAGRRGQRDASTSITPLRLRLSPQDGAYGNRAGVREQGRLDPRGGPVCAGVHECRSAWRSGSGLWTRAGSCLGRTSGPQPAPGRCPSASLRSRDHVLMEGLIVALTCKAAALLRAAPRHCTYPREHGCRSRPAEVRPETRDSATTPHRLGCGIDRVDSTPTRTLSGITGYGRGSRAVNGGVR